MKKQWMSRRERVMTALAHHEPDRVPISMTITVDAYNNLKKYMGVELDEKSKVGRWTDVTIHPTVAEKFGLDVLRVDMGSPKKRPKSNDPDVLIDEWHVEWKLVNLPDGGYYYEMCKHPLADATLKDLDDFQWPDPNDEGLIDGVEERFRDLRQNTDFAITTKIGGAVFELATYMVGMQRWYTVLAEDPDFAYALMARIADIQAQIDMLGLQKVGKFIDILRLSGEDLGTQQGPLISVPMFRRLVRPHLEKVWKVAKTELTKRNPDGKIMLHSCGSVRPFMRDWADMGLDVLDPIQPRPKNMDTAAIKADVGDRLSFHGGIDIQHVLPFGTVEEVRQEVRQRIKDLAPGGGYLLAPAHNVQSDVPPENLIAMRDAVEEFGYYPIHL
ncbi:MAG: uroporphyrinogen decarboxylase family protein [Anaerolineaceae bacterium]|nr:uroporphyrinogen decarboxylase family protein [Anaerolineaceae bacterium]